MTEKRESDWFGVDRKTPDYSSDKVKYSLTKTHYTLLETKFLNPDKARRKYYFTMACFEIFCSEITQ